MDSKFVNACVMETIYMYLFLFHDIKMSLLVCDGASPNIAVIKKSHSHTGAYSVNLGKDDIFQVEPWMVNPWNPPHRIFWLICPSHQVRFKFKYSSFFLLLAKEHDQCLVFVQGKWHKAFSTNWQT